MAHTVPPAPPSRDPSSPGAVPLPARRRRLRKALIAVAIAVAGMAVLLGVLLYWLLMTIGGRDFVLGQIGSRLPEGTELQWQRVDGPLTGPLSIEGLRLVQRSCVETDGTVVPPDNCPQPRTLSFEAGLVAVDLRVLPLFGRVLKIESFVLEDAVLNLPPSIADDEPFTLPEWPDVLPQIGPLPFAVHADDIRIEDVQVFGEAGPLIHVHSLHGGARLDTGFASLDAVQADTDRGQFQAHGRYAPRDNYRADLTASAVLPAPLGRTRPNVQLVVRGDLDDLVLDIDGQLPSPLQAQLRIAGGTDRPAWQLEASSRGLDPVLLAGGADTGTPIVFNLQGRGSGGENIIEGHFQQGDLEVTLLPSTLHVRDQVVELAPLSIALFEGRIDLRGQADFTTAEDPEVDLVVEVRGLQLGGEAGQPVIEAGADATLGGRLSDWRLVAGADFVREREGARVDIEGHGDGEGMVLQTLRATTPGGRLQGAGEVRWTPALSWVLNADLQGLDPGYFLADWSGSIRGRLSTEGHTDDAGALTAEGRLSDLGGNLRGRALAGQAQFAMRGPETADPDGVTHIDGDAAISLGDSRISARAVVAETLDVDARLTPLHLADLLPGGSGVLQGRVQLSGARTAPEITANMEGSNLGLNEMSVDSLSLSGRLPWQSGSGELTLRASGVSAGIEIDSLQAQASGRIEALQLEAAVRGPVGDLDLAADTRLTDAGLSGTINRLRLAPADTAAWQLRSPAAFAQAGNAFRLDEACFDGANGGALCAQANWPNQGLSVTGTAVPLALADAWLPEQEPGVPWRVQGELNLDAQLRPVGNAFEGHVRVQSSEGGVRLGERARRNVVSYRDLDLDAQFTPQAITATLSSSIDDSGSLRAEIATGWDNGSALSGMLSLDINDLTFVELFSPDIVEPSGRLSAQLALGGTRSQPELGGNAALSDFRTELPALALLLQDGNFRLDAQPDGTATLAGNVRAGDGVLNIDGNIDLGTVTGTGLAVDLGVQGDNLLVADTPELRAIASPDIRVRYAPPRPLEVTGQVTIPSAQVNIEGFGGGGAGRSSDVVVLDPVAGREASEPLQIRLDVNVVVGDDVNLEGYGLDASVSGQLRVRQSPGRDITGLGAIQVAGEFAAFGQELQIARGNISWSNDIISDPVLDIRATRRIEAEDITAGVDVTGRIASMQIEPWTDPARDRSEALAYLITGRSLSMASSDEAEQFNAASAALAAGGGLIAGQIGSRIGLDNAGVSHSRALGGNVIGAGRQISPRLYVGFGVSLLGTGQVLTLRYMINRFFDAEIESSTLENRGSLNWRRER